MHQWHREKQGHIHLLELKTLFLFQFTSCDLMRREKLKNLSKNGQNATDVVQFLLDNRKHFRLVLRSLTANLSFLPLPWCSPLCVWVDWLFGAWAAASWRQWCGGSSSRPAGCRMWTKRAPSSPSHRQGRPHPPTSAFSASYPSCQCLRSPAEGAKWAGKKVEDKAMVGGRGRRN